MLQNSQMMGESKEGDAAGDNKGFGCLAMFTWEVLIAITSISSILLKKTEARAKIPGGQQEKENH